MLALAQDEGHDAVGGQKSSILHAIQDRTVTLYSGSVVLKKGRRLKLDEKYALEFAAHINLPVPQVYNAQKDSGEGETSLWMEYIHGDRLDLVWPSMTECEKDHICNQLREILETMRSAPSTNRRIGSCSDGSARDLRQYSDYSGGPFLDEASFNLFYCDLVQTTPSPVLEALHQQLRTDHRIVFSHCDLSQHNILVKNGKITGLLDWEYAGWYPEHWEYIKLFDRPSKHVDWKNRARQIFPQSYSLELVCHQAITRWQRP
ncbi:kinase-like protein [Pseudovirgaria hyperparasitica]|uniref:Kinase-like protein n=1 Tax=Pseudovirgaria hyperparasitica TaxID=470096 RepID=A0A6A6W4Y8_9PEZI|nr:kinase-like protein [Pseudovirgaria hyperparasitica]KAF2757104.1 kinase-like protein [Pseudovirgaria hyperparasitica]